jgi:hypothetical protein
MIILYNIISEMKMSIPAPFKWYWIICWKFVTPLILCTLLVIKWVRFGSVNYEGYVYPIWVQIIGYLITASTVVWIPAFAVFEAVKGGGNEHQKSLLRHTSHWGRKTIKYGACAKDLGREKGAAAAKGEEEEEAETTFKADDAKNP